MQETYRKYRVFVAARLLVAQALLFKCNKSVYIQDGRQAAILNDIKNLFDVHNPQTVPVLGLKFQTS